MIEKNIQKLNQIFITVFELDENIHLDDLDLQNDYEKWDSLAHVLLIAAIESEFSISIGAVKILFSNYNTQHLTQKQYASQPFPKSVK
jgi:acyl carrier protein